ncbi:Sir2 family NAD-dependent protein deacetylase [Enterobacter asburiae]|uniref:Sir2 family NAD-dependent protein deacetylase n=1 Tax=Enterobacteriaceae TaxID=543 RepID=UPI000B491562|nr:MULTISPECIES: Sir2 family NAD-dependent protein deacetylase [Enterobacteriaceae]OWG34826.1 hypothetical protein CAL36_02360 [Enterobacter kobei]
MSRELTDAIHRIHDADAIVIGASNGLSIAAGIHLFAEDAAFLHKFGDLRLQHGFRNIIRGCFHSFPGEADKWAFYSRMYDYFLNDRMPDPVMENLLTLVKNKNYFVITSNIDAHFLAAGFNPERVFEFEGNCQNLQCATACHDQLYPGDELLSIMAREQQNGKVPSHLVPACPKCGGHMQVHIETGHTFLKGSQWQARQKAFSDFLIQGQDKKIVFLELGVGARNPFIKAPFMARVQQEPYASYITFNIGAELYIPDVIRGKSIGLDGDIADNLRQLVQYSVC